MTSPRSKTRPAVRWMGVMGAVGGVALVALPGLAQARPLDLVYERTVMSAADARCNLFTPDVASALAAGAAQARGAALRSGVSPDDVRGVVQDARRKAAQADCNSRDIAIATGRVKSAFAGFAKLARLNYPGDVAEWRADRTGAADLRWRLKQDTAFGADKMSFGLAGKQGTSALVAVGRFADGAQPYAARLIMRDDARSSGAYLDRQGTGPTAGLPLAKRLPPRMGQKIYSASFRSPAGQDLLPKGETTGWAFRFPDEAAQALANLDPRESVAVEFLFPSDRDGVRRAYVEVGDFAAGRAFVQLAQR